MSELTQLEMTLDEARETDRLIKRHINTTRYLLLDMRDRKGWKALGYESFVEYGEKEPVSYTHLDVYKRQDHDSRNLPMACEQRDQLQF